VFIVGLAIDSRPVSHLLVHNLENPGWQKLITPQTRLPKLPTLLSTQLRNLVSYFERLVGHTLPVVPVRQNMDGLEIEFANGLVEDSNNDALSYTDCELCL
jgi:hypothetical protein